MCLIILLEIVHGELSQRQHVLVVKSIEWPDRSEGFVNQSVVLLSVQLQHVHGDSKHVQTDHKDDREESDIIQSIDRKSDEERRRLEKLEPIEHLNDKCKRSECGQDSLVLKRWILCIKEIDHDDPNGREELEDIQQVDDVQEVL